MVSTSSYSGLLVAAVATAAVMPTINAHAVQTLPEPTCSAGWCSNSPVGIVNGPKALGPSPITPEGYNYGPSQNVAAYEAALKQSSYKSMRDMVKDNIVLESGATFECGFGEEGSPQPLPEQVEWTELTSSHEGPCEVWCDDELAFEDGNCAKNYPGSPAKLPYDKSKCEGKNVLQTIWLAMHVPDWQAYINCALIEGGSGAATGGSGASAPASADASASASASAAETPASEFETSPSAGSDTSGPSPTEAPATETPSTGCAAKKRRLRN